MTLEEVKVIRIVDYLNNMGYVPLKVSGNNYWYRSPIRDEHTASFKVDDAKNLWYDFGEGHGGNLIELCKYLYDTKDVHLILLRIEAKAKFGDIVHQSAPRATREPVSKKEVVYHFQPLSHPVLCSYIASRLVDVKIAMKYCKEVRYMHGVHPCFGIAFPNDSGGYEMRNAKFKRCIGKKDITTIRSSEDSTAVAVFEGFMDFLSFLTLSQHNKHIKEDARWADYVIMNSVSNVKRTIERVKDYDFINLFLDTDEAGRKATACIKEELGDKVVDHSWMTLPYKDVNDYLQHNPHRLKSTPDE